MGEHQGSKNMLRTYSRSHKSQVDRLWYFAMKAFNLTNPIVSVCLTDSGNEKQHFATQPYFVTVLTVGKCLCSDGEIDF